MLHRHAHVLDLGGRLARLRERRRIHGLDELHAGRHGLERAERHAARVDQQRRAVRQRRERRTRGVVGADVDAILRERRGQRRRYLAVGDEQRRAIGADHCVRNEYRIEVDVGAAQVEQPREIVERRHEMPLRALRVHRAADVGQLARARRVGLRRHVLEHRIAGQPRPLGPDRIEQVDVGTQRDAARTQRGRQPARGRDAEHGAVDPNRRARRHVLREPVDVRRALLPARHLHQLHARARQFGVGLHPVAAVDPQPREVRGDDQRADRTREAGQPAARLPAFGQVFGQVGIGGRHEIGGQVLADHGVAQ